MRSSCRSSRSWSRTQWRFCRCRTDLSRHCPNLCRFRCSALCSVWNTRLMFAAFDLAMFSKERETGVSWLGTRQCWTRPEAFVWRVLSVCIAVCCAYNSYESHSILWGSNRCSQVLRISCRRHSWCWNHLCASFRSSFWNASRKYHRLSKKQIQIIQGYFLDRTSLLKIYRRRSLGSCQLWWRKFQ